MEPRSAARPRHPERDRGPSPGAYDRPVTCRFILLSAVLLVTGLSVVGCSSDESTTTTSTTREPTTTTPPPSTAVPADEAEVANEYRQGLARLDDGWIFSADNALFRTDDTLVEQARLLPAIPPAWAQQGYDHIGDIDAADGILYAPLEVDDKERGEQAMARYDAATLELIDVTPVPQHHASFVAVDPDSGIAYSQDRFGGDTVLRYDVSGGGWEPLEPLALSMFVDRVQGGDVGDGALWLSTDDEQDGLYRVDLETGEVTALGSVGRIEGEAEGMEYAVLDSGSLHVLTIDAALRPVWFVHFDLR